MPSQVDKASSYSTHGYAQLLTSLVIFYRPKIIVEFGVLNGYSLEALIEGSRQLASQRLDHPLIRAYDIFDECTNFASADRTMLDKFEGTVQYGNFYTQHEMFTHNSIDMFHIDIGNTGETFNFFIENYLPKLAWGGVALLEGGSKDRDAYRWMNKYPKIRDALQFCPYPYFVFEPWPSLTLIQKI
jgi:hypothetical protein